MKVSRELEKLAYVVFQKCAITVRDVSKIGFVMGKARVAQSKGHLIPHLELCAAVLPVEVADFVVKQLDVEIRNVRYYTDSTVVLGYISNGTTRFYTYVSLKVQRILRSSNPFHLKQSC